MLRAVTENYLRRSGVDIKLDHGVDNMAMAMSLVASTRGLVLMAEGAPAVAEVMVEELAEPELRELFLRDRRRAGRIEDFVSAPPQTYWERSPGGNVRKRLHGT